MTARFELDSRLAADTVEVADLPLCHVRLMNDRAVPWLLLIPRKADLRELHQLNKKERGQLMDEVVQAQHVLEDLFRPDKLNIGALGNMVTQFHMHVIARFKLDRAWPNAIWNTSPIVRYPHDEMEHMLRSLRGRFGQEKPKKASK